MTLLRLTEMCTLS